MSHLIAKTKGKDGEFFKVLSTQRIFSANYNLEDSIEYDPDTLLEEDSWYCLSDFSEQEFFLERLGEKFVSTDFLQIEKDDYLNIDFLFEYHNGIYYFQKITNKNIIAKRFLQLGDEPRIKSHEPLIVIDDTPDAIYIEEEDTIYFRKLTKLAALFKGAELLYREATQIETEEFLANSFITLEDGYSAEKVKPANRKRIALAMEQLNSFSAAGKKTIIKYITGYKHLRYDKKKGSFEIKSENDLKLLLYGIEERLFTTPVSKKPRIANSILDASQLTNE